MKGPHLQALYDVVKGKSDKKYVYGYNSGRESILSVLIAGGIGQGDKVILPSYCCETVAQAVVTSGATPLFCDVEGDYNPDVNHILELISPEVKAIIFPHLFGKPGRIDILEAELEKRNLRSQILLIDDAAQSFGAQLNHRLVGTFGDAGIISFGPGKTMTATGGGLVITDNDELGKRLGGLPPGTQKRKQKFKKLMYWLIFRRWRKYTKPFYPYVRKWFVSPLAGDMVMELANIDAAIALKQFERLEEFIEIRIRRKGQLDNLKANCLESLEFPDHDLDKGGCLNIATKYVVRQDSEGSGEDAYSIYQDKFNLNTGIEILKLYTPIHLMPEYGQTPEVKLPKTESYYKHLMQIPIDPSINDADFAYITRIFQDLLSCFHSASIKLSSSNSSNQMLR